MQPVLVGQRSLRGIQWLSVPRSGVAAQQRFNALRIICAACSDMRECALNRRRDGSRRVVTGLTQGQRSADRAGIEERLGLRLRQDMFEQ